MSLGETWNPTGQSTLCIQINTSLQVLNMAAQRLKQSGACARPSHRLLAWDTDDVLTFQLVCEDKILAFNTLSFPRGANGRGQT
jgi:hypothetical protein